nr:hypothetical protein [uncultured Mediterranean phage uvMED]
MAYTTINKSTDYFNTKLYTGNGSTNAIASVGFEPSWTWIKNRGDTHAHVLVDAVRGVTKELRSSGTNAEITTSNSFTSFDSDGFTLGADSTDSYNKNSNNYVSWNWKGNGAGSSNTDGDITSTVSANTTSGFSIVKYTGNGSASNIGHGLGTALKTIIIKKTSGTADWLMGHNSLHATLPWKYGINLNNTGAVHESGSYFADTAPTNSVFRVEANDEVNTSGQTYIAYCFAEKKGFSKFSSFVGNGSADGPFLFCGFKPAFIILKNINDGAKNWEMLDNKRPSSGQNPADDILFPDTSDAESASQTDRLVDFVSNGVKIRGNSAQMNGNGNTHIFMAFAEAPLVGSNNVPANAR